MHARTRGFTLVELAVVVAIVGLLLGAILSPLARQYEVRKNRDTETVLEDVKKALVGYALANRRLPCPDTDNPPDGTENCGGGIDLGYVPWITLGVPPGDSWGRLIGYQVALDFTEAATPGAGCESGTTNRLDLCDTGTITVSTRGPGKVAMVLTNSAPAVLLSPGANGYGGREVVGGALAAPAAGTDEATNATDDDAYISRIHTGGGDNCSDTAGTTTPYCEFDDLVAWLSGPILLGELVKAGVLP